MMNEFVSYLVFSANEPQKQILCQYGNKEIRIYNHSQVYDSSFPV
jgi:hypothetical protein